MSILLEALKKAEQAQSPPEMSEGFDFGNTATVSLSSATKIRNVNADLPRVQEVTKPCELTLDAAQPKFVEVAEPAPDSRSNDAAPAVLYHQFVAHRAASTRWYYIASALGTVLILVLLAAYFVVLKGTDGALIDPKAIRHSPSSHSEPLKVEIPSVPKEQLATRPLEKPDDTLAPKIDTPHLTTQALTAPSLPKEPVVGLTPQFVLNESRAIAFTEPSTDKLVQATKQTKPIEIVKHQDLDRPEFALLQQAYAAYQKADWEKARKLYRQVQKRDPQQRDALLGLAAIARHQNQILQARNYYQILLQMNPKDADSWAGLLSLQEQGGSIEDQAAIKQMIYQDPNAAALHFSLGNSYAAQGQWMDAQQAYFQAYQRETSNGNYAYNLAVSLDHINQVSAAVRYYQLALTLTRNQAVHFDRAQVQARLQRLAKKAP